MGYVYVKKKKVIQDIISMMCERGDFTR